MPGRNPTLPAKGGKKAAPTTEASLPVLSAQFIELEDGSKIPIKIPPGMSAEQAVGIVDYLKANPEAAKAAWEQAQAVMHTPGMAAAFMGGMAPSSAAAGSEVFEALKDDPELQEVFDDVKENGPGALQKYWEDTDLMSKISSKMRQLQLSRQQQGGAGQQQQDGAAPGKAAPPAKKVETLHDAARWGDAAAAAKMIDEGADVNAKNDRGIPALGVAVGFNQREVVQLLLDRGADVAAADSKGSTALHYAAGYGRREVAAVLLEAGSDPSAKNQAGQTPADVAKVNGEKKMVEWLKECAAKAAA